jgi:5'-nucleotidase
MSKGRLQKRWTALLGALAIVGATVAAAPVAAQDEVLTCGGIPATIVAEPGVPTEGTSGPDVIVGTDGADIISGKGGSDLICGGGGNDSLRGGIGNDIIAGEGGRDMIQGGAGSDILTGGAQADSIQGGDNRDFIFGFRGADLLDGGKGNDRIVGGAGNDTLIGNNGRNDLLIGGKGVDTCNDDQGTTRQRGCEGGTAGSLDLTILHINDHHSHLDPDSADLVLGGEETRVSIGGFPNVVAKMNELTDAADGWVAKVHAGDAITGTLFYSLFNGEADAAMMNQACFDVFALGNHEFDDSDQGLADFLGFLGDDPCGTSVIAANVVPQVGTPLEPVEGQSLIQPYEVIDYGGQLVGFVGIDIANKTQNSSSPLETTQFLDEVETAQAQIDELAGLGVNKIVLVTHIQLANDLNLASMVTGVDVIVGGDSHSLLGDFEDLGLNPVDTYPVNTTDAAGNPVCIVQAWQYSAIVGELNVSWDGSGNVTSCDGTPHLLLNDTFERELVEDEGRVELEGDLRDAVLADIDAIAELSIVTPDAATQEILDGFSGQVDELTLQVIGTVTEDLCLERIPGQGRSNICDVEDTAVNGGDIQQLVAEAFRSRSFTSDIAIQNAGGVRIDIPAGDLTIADAYTLLPFANTIVEMDMTGAEIKQVLEEAVTFALDPEGSTGAYPYAAGLRWDMDLTAAEGSRLSNLEFKARDSEVWVPFDLEADYVVATNDFISGGRDGYLTFGTVSDDGRVTDTFLDYAKTFIDYVEMDAEGTIGKLPVDEYSTQSFVGVPEA